MTAFHDDDAFDTEPDQELDHQELDLSLYEHVPEGWNDGTDADATLSFDALFGRDDEACSAIPDDCYADALGEAAAELALAQKRIDALFARFLSALTDQELDRLEPRDQEVVRAFRALPERERKALRARFSDPWHDTAHLRHDVESLERMLDDTRALRLCEPESRRTTEPPSRRAAEPQDNAEWPVARHASGPVGIASPTEPAVREPLLYWKETITCACCETPVAFELVAPAAARDCDTVSAATERCPCGATLSVAYSWGRQKLVGLRMTPPRLRVQ